MISVEVQNLGKRYGSTTVFQDLSFRHTKGVLGIGGSNGSGKSTLLKCLAGLERPTSGSVLWKKGSEKMSHSELKEKLGYVAPYINLYHDLTIKENLELILQLRKQDRSKQIDDEFWDKLQLSGLQNKPFGELSTGQRQRARLACTLSYKPSVLFLDEPGANLDERGRQAIQDILRDYRQADNMVLLASNDPNELDLTDTVFSVE